MSQVTVISGRERRRRWNDEERARILTEAFSPDACVAAVARRNDVSTSLIYQWRDKFREPKPDPIFVEAIVGDNVQQSERYICPAAVVEFSCGIKVVVSGSASPSLAAAILGALR